MEIETDANFSTGIYGNGNFKSGGVTLSHVGISPLLDRSIILDVSSLRDNRTTFLHIYQPEKKVNDSLVYGHGEEGEYS